MAKQKISIISTQRSRGVLADIVNTVQFTRAVVIATNYNDDKIVFRWSALGERLGRLYSFGGTIADIDKGIRVTEDPIFLFDRLNKLAFYLEFRFEESVEIEDIDKAISLQARYIYTEELSDLYEAIMEAYNVIKAMVAISPEVRAAIGARVNVFRYLENLLTLRHKKIY
ncbi:hypothetical protein N7449_004244 [Penicillium cf. viridicatum]|uniref:Uncharacterized protein n=1 Tax=Penicillium cf. viridicatum TaxID=2972119 RepID=A0A9W9MJ14_9EURO|nr:hypothetical protein N7449_004244 [Penicillium cf. viridicatum]